MIPVLAERQGQTERPKNINNVVILSMGKQAGENKRVLYTKLAKYYDYLVPSTTEKECDFLDKVFNKFGGGQIKKILDLGCGTGRHASLLQKMGYKITGIDLSKVMLKIAKEKSPNSSFIKMDFCFPTFEKKYFDASICMWSTIGYIPDKDKFKEFVRNVSGITGKILILSSTNHEGENFQPKETVEKTTPIPGGEIRTKMIRNYDKNTGIREENYEYSIIEKGRETKFTDRNRLRLWKIDEIKNLLLPEFGILEIYGDYSMDDHYDKNKSNKKILVAQKVIF